MSIYKDGTYLSKNPSWHLEDSPFKAKYIHKILSRASITPTSLVEVGCGVGGILSELHERYYTNANFTGYDISPEAIALAKEQHARKNIQFFCRDIDQINSEFDVLIAADVFEHVPDYLGFLQSCRRLAQYKLFHIPLDIHMSSVFRGTFPSGLKSIGHLHYFSQESALEILSHSGYRIVDSLLTPGAIELAKLHPSIRKTLANIPRRLVSTFSDRWACRLLGGYSLLVLAE